MHLGDLLATSVTIVTEKKRKDKKQMSKKHRTFVPDSAAGFCPSIPTSVPFFPFFDTLPTTDIT
jgi:hypothetical protein